MPAKKKPTPEPVPQFVVCSLCGELWSSHEEVNGEVSTLECIRLLKMKRYTPTGIVPWRQYPPTYPWYSTMTSASGAGQTINCATPTVALASATS